MSAETDYLLQAIVNRQRLDETGDLRRLNSTVGIEACTLEANPCLLPPNVANDWASVDRAGAPGLKTYAVGQESVLVPTKGQKEVATIQFDNVSRYYSHDRFADPIYAASERPFDGTPVTTLMISLSIYDAAGRPDDAVHVDVSVPGTSTIFALEEVRLDEPSNQLLARSASLEVRDVIGDLWVMSFFIVRRPPG